MRTSLPVTADNFRLSFLEVHLYDSTKQLTCSCLLAEEMAEETSEFKIAVIGRSGVGKSRVVSNFLSNNEGDATEGPYMKHKFNFLFFKIDSSEGFFWRFGVAN